MIIWNGRGFLVAVIAFACLLGSEFLTESYFRDDAYYQQHGWPKLAAFVIAGVIVWWLGMRWKDQSERVVIEKDTGKEFVLRRDDSFFFIHMKYWGPLLCALGIVFFFVQD
jgi:hypothetical protein